MTANPRSAGSNPSRSALYGKLLWVYCGDCGRAAARERDSCHPSATRLGGQTALATLILSVPLMRASRA